MTIPAPDKSIRSAIIADYVRLAGYRGVVCFSCGTASAALKSRVPYVVDVSPTGDLLPVRWWTPAEIRRAWPDLFDATCGHLPLHLMAAIANAFGVHYNGLFVDGQRYNVPTGSGETILCLRMEFPRVIFVPVWGATPGTKKNDDSLLVRLLSGAGIEYEREPPWPEDQR